MPVMNVRIVRVRVDEGLVLMPMAVRLVRPLHWVIVRPVLVLMMLIMHMHMLVCCEPQFVRHFGLVFMRA